MTNFESLREDFFPQMLMVLNILEDNTFDDIKKKRAFIEK